MLDTPQQKLVRTFGDENRLPCRHDLAHVLDRLQGRQFEIGYADVAQPGEFQRAGCFLVGRKLEGGGIALEFLYVDSVISQCDMTNAQFLVLLSMLVSTLVESLRQIGVDVDGYMRRFPPPLF